MTPASTLQAVADRLGVGAVWQHPRALATAAVLSLALWGAIGWGLGWLVERLVQR